jgi:hypothetical protein
LNSKPTKLELSLHGNEIFRSLGHGEQWTHIQQHIRLTLLISFINWNRCVVRCHSHLENMAKEINYIATGKLDTLYMVFDQKLHNHRWRIMLGLEKP